MERSDANYACLAELIANGIDPDDFVQLVLVRLFHYLWDLNEHETQ